MVRIRLPPAASHPLLTCRQRPHGVGFGVRSRLGVAYSGRSLRRISWAGIPAGLPVPRAHRLRASEPLTSSSGGSELLGEQLFDVSVAQGEAEIEPNRGLDCEDLASCGLPPFAATEAAFIAAEPDGRC